MDRLELRIEIGKAVRAMNEAHDKSFNDPSAVAVRKKLDAEWRKLRDQADAARQTLETFQRSMVDGNWKEKQAVLKLQEANPDLLLMTDEYLPHGEPRVMTCAITGLAIFEGDEIIGNEDYGFVALKDAIEIRSGIPSLTDNTGGRDG